jgi:pyruvate carboxylase
MGVAEEWDEIKLAYADANQILGDIVKVTPSRHAEG